jgi:ADP-ribose pyrophosphatase YjhB (NUDIX family)
MGDLARHVVAALVFIRQDNEILLVKQNDGERFWSLPGGVVEIGESVEQAAVREVHEETGLAVRIQRVVGLYSKPGEGSIAIALEATVIGGALRPAVDEIAECRYFALDDLPDHAREHLRQRVDDFSRGLPAAVWRTQ